MRCKLIRNWTAGVALALLSAVAPQAAKAYQVDCAILLCLAGGWPASAECAHARAVFIRRITPWPIEPPLQIWRCPMGVSERAPLQSTAPKIWEASNHNGQTLAQVIQAQVAEGSADIDISGLEFDFVRSIRVWDVRYYSHRERGRDAIGADGLDDGYLYVCEIRGEGGPGHRQEKQRCAFPWLRQRGKRNT